MAANFRPKIVTLVSHYVPGFKAGGPIRSVANLIDALGDEFDFRVITRDRDAGDSAPYAGVPAGNWTQVGAARVCYLHPSATTPLRIARELNRVRPDVVYLNSFFDAKWSLLSLAAARNAAGGRWPLIIAPRGQFAAGALRFNPRIKRLYLVAYRSLGMHRRVSWHATCDAERDDVRRVIGHDANVYVAPNLSTAPTTVPMRAPKQPGHLRLAFLSRVSPKKNLRGALEIISRLSGNVLLDIWGPVEDSTYEQRCRQQTAALPAHIAVRWCGLVAPARVAETLSHYDALLLPTFGENFGHAIVESLAAGCPVVISNRTPWQQLETQGVGWDLPLDQPEAFRRALDSLCAMNEAEHAPMRERAVDFARATVRTMEYAEAHRSMFEAALHSGANSNTRAVSRAA